MREAAEHLRLIGEKIPISDNVVPVKYFLSALTRALRRARHFALVAGSAIPTQARS